MLIHMDVFDAIWLFFVLICGVAYLIIYLIAKISDKLSKK